MMRMKKKVKLATFILLAIILIIITLRSAIIREILFLIIISFIIAYSLKPIHEKMKDKGVENKTGALILILGLVLAIVLCFVILIPSIFKEGMNINNTVKQADSYFEQFYLKLEPIKNNNTFHKILDNINYKTSNIIMEVFNKVFDGIVSLAEDVVSFSVLPIIVYYFIVDFEKMGNKFITLFPFGVRTILKKIGKDVDKVMGRYIISQLFLSLIIGVITFIILILLHVNFPVILSLLNAIFNIIPYFGPLFGALPAIVVALLVSPKTALWTCVWLFLLQQVEGNIISPKITGDSIYMHPLTIILLLVIGGKLAGFLGMVLAVPLGAVIKIIIDDINYYIY